MPRIFNMPVVVPRTDWNGPANPVGDLDAQMRRDGIGRSRRGWAGRTEATPLAKIQELKRRAVELQVIDALKAEDEPGKGRVPVQELAPGLGLWVFAGTMREFLEATLEAGWPAPAETVLHGHVGEAIGGMVAIANPQSVTVLLGEPERVAWFLAQLPRPPEPPETSAE